MTDECWKESSRSDFGASCCQCRHCTVMSVIAGDCSAQDFGIVGGLTLSVRLSVIIAALICVSGSSNVTQRYITSSLLSCIIELLHVLPLVAQFTYYSFLVLFVVWFLADKSHVLLFLFYLAHSWKSCFKTVLGTVKNWEEKKYNEFRISLITVLGL